jgi:hypothetical protein
MTPESAATVEERCPHGELVGWHCAGCLWGCGEDDHEHATECTCTNWCGESSEAGCCFCVARDIYEPCPAVGFGCGLGAKSGSPSCDCCTVEQWQAARSA